MTEADDKRKRAKEVASLRGQAGTLQTRADKLSASARIPYSSYRNEGVCSVCQQSLEPGSNYSVIPHTPKTCPGPGAATGFGQK